jgi:hypothetical protein
MKRITALLASTHIDQHNEAFAVSALQAIVDQVNAAYIPLGLEHDPRIPPVGRVVSAEIEETRDGEFAVVGVMELFEEGDKLPFGGGLRRALVRFCESEAVVVIDDRAFMSSEDQALIEEVRAVLNAERVTETKKSLVPIAVLTLALKLAGTGLMSGVFAKIGGDSWSALKPKLKKLFARKRDTPAQILNLAFTIVVSGEPRLIEVVLSDPAASDIDSIGPLALEEAIATANIEIVRAPYLVRIVFAYSALAGLQLQFAVASSGVPVLFAGSLPPIPQLKGLSVGGSDADA